MRLLFMNERLGYAGTSSYTLDLALALKRDRHDVQICTTGGPLRDVFGRFGIETYLVKFNLLSMRTLLEFLREYDPHLIHIQNRQSTVFGRKISRKLGVPHIVTVHRLPESPSPRLNDPLLAGVIAVNEVIRESLVNNLGVPKSLVRVIPRGVNVDVFAPETGRDPGDRPPSGRAYLPVLGSVGRLSRIKGHDVFIRAARKVLDSGIEAMFAIVGDGEDGSRLWRLVKELRLEKSVMFSAHIPDRRELYRLFDIVVVPTLRGGVGSTVLEAMAAGKPVIASAVGEVLHIVQDGKTGLLVPQGDVGALAARMADLISRPDLSADLARAARGHAVEHFALSPMLQATLGFYAEVHDRLGEPAISGGA